MIYLPTILAQLGQTVFVVAGVFAVTFVMFTFLMIWASRYSKVGPSQALVISGRVQPAPNSNRPSNRVGYRILTGGGAFVWPVVEKADVLSLEVINIEIEITEARASGGVPVRLKAAAQAKINSDPASLRLAAECLLSKSKEEVSKTVANTLEASLRILLSSRTLDSVSENLNEFISTVQQNATKTMTGMGLSLLSFDIRELNETFTKQPL